MSVPVGTIDGAPVGMQIIGRHHEEQVLLDLALLAERERPWPLVAPSPGAVSCPSGVCARAGHADRVEPGPCASISGSPPPHR